MWTITTCYGTLQLLILIVCNDASASTTATTAVFSHQEILLVPENSSVVLKSGEHFVLYCRSKTPIKWIYKKQEGAKIVAKDVFETESEYPYVSELHLKNVSEWSVQYYTCQSQSDYDLNKKIYIFVNGSVLSVPKTNLEYKSNGTTLIPCKPTSPDIKVQLFDHDKQFEKFEYYKETEGFVLAKDYYPDDDILCIFTKGNHHTTALYSRDDYVEPPEIYPNTNDSTPLYATVGQNITFTCLYRDLILALKWTLPTDQCEIGEQYENDEFDESYLDVFVKNLTKDHSGEYECTVLRDGGRNRSTLVTLKVLAPNETFINVIPNSRKYARTAPIGSTVHYQLTVESYPDILVKLLKNGRSVANDCVRMVNVLGESNENRFALKKYDMKFERNLTSLNDTGVYTIALSNSYNRSLQINITLRVTAEPKVSLQVNTYYDKGSPFVNIKCLVRGYPIGEIYFEFEPDCLRKYMGRCETTYIYPHKVTSMDMETTILTEIPLETEISGNLTCVAKSNNTRMASVRKQFVIYDINNGFGIVRTGNNITIIENFDLHLNCKASKYLYGNQVYWMKDGFNAETFEGVEVKYKEGLFSHELTLIVFNVKPDHRGVYECRIKNHNLTDSIQVNIKDVIPATIIDSNLRDQSEYFQYMRLHLYCYYKGVPQPTISWYKDSEKIVSDNRTEILPLKLLPDETVNSSLVINELNSSDEGFYKCQIENQYATIEVKTELLTVLVYAKISWYWYGLLALISLILLSIIFYLWIRVRSERRLRKMLEEAGLYRFNEGCLNEIDKSKLIAVQAHKLPYDKSYEFFRQDLKLGHILGEGAFGVVFRGEAKGIVNAEEWTPVAVKMVKNDATNQTVKALTMELKILMYIGKHINIVNLLGACTNNINKRELLVIVEYCEFGNIRDYLFKHRHVFNDIWNLNRHSSAFDNQAFLSSTCANNTMSSDYNVLCDSNATNTTLLNSISTVRTRRGASQSATFGRNRGISCGSNYSDTTALAELINKTRPLSTTQLLQWSYQVANGMEYLTNRKVVHGDLAARNILLATDNIVKICDFGLARQTQDDIYKKGKLDKVPMKWMALEALTEGVYSTQSDVWSYGIFLWELFSLGSSPYPGVRDYDILIDRLAKNYRLEKPKYSNEDVYRIMLECWRTEPKSRPSFTSLRESFQKLIDDDEAQRISSLNEVYGDSTRGDNDYLEMIASPDIENIMPSLYANVPIAPPQPQATSIDPDGYLQMSVPSDPDNIFSPRPLMEENVFQFDPIKANQDMTTNIELYPILPNTPIKAGSIVDCGAYVAMSKKCERIKSDDSGFYNLEPNEGGVSNPTYTIITNPLPPRQLHSYQNINIRL